MKDSDDLTDPEPAEAKQDTLTEYIESDGTPSDIEMSDLSDTNSEEATQRIEQYSFVSLLIK